MSTAPRARRSLLRAGLAATATMLVAALMPAAGADPLPFNDANVQGAIGLCDASGHPLTAGATLTHPFTVAAGSSVAAPAGYDAKAKAKATLYAFQPRKDVDPGQWTGYQLTGGSIFADASHPLVAGTNLDPSLQDFLTSYPARWDGLVELRMYYTAPGKVAYRRTYPAAVLRASGGRWTVLQAANLSCDLSRVVSSEKLMLPASAFDPAHPAVTDAPSLAGSSVSASSATSHPSASASTGRSATSSVPPSVAVSLTKLAETSSSSGANSAPWVALLVVGLGIAGLAGAAFWRARRRTTR